MNHKPDIEDKRLTAIGRGIQPRGMGAMKYSVCVALIAALIGFGSSARAATYDWSFTSPTGSGSGTLETDVPVGPAQIIGITGNWNGNSITGLTNYQGNDNTLYALTPNLALDFDGFSFATAVESVNVFYCTSANSPSCSVDGGYWFVANFNNPGGPGTFTVSAQGAATPLPAALPLFASGLGMLGWATRRRQHN